MAIKSFLSEGGFSVGSVGSAPIEVIDSSGNITAVGLTVSGNLVVNGSTTTINSTTTTLDDPIFTLGGDTVPTSDDNKDRGIEFRWHDGSLAKVGFFGFDDSTGKFVFIPNATNTSEVFSGTKGTIDANLEWADVLSKPSPVVTVTLTGDVTGTANATLTSLGNGTVTISTTVAADSVALGTDTTGAYVQAINNGSYLTGGNGPSGSESAVLTLAVDATSANTASKVVARDASGNFSAGTITATGGVIASGLTANSWLFEARGTAVYGGFAQYGNNIKSVQYWNASNTISVGSSYSANVANDGDLIVSGKIGVGTLSPGGKLEVNFTAATGATALILRTSDSGANGAIRWQNSGGTNQAGIGSNFNVSDVGALEFLNGTTTNVIFRSSGSVGIGITAPEAALHVAKTGADEQLILGSAATNRDISMAMYSGTTKAEVLRFQSAFRLMHGASNSITQQSFFTSGGERLTIVSGGNIGIGTASPGAKLHIAGPHADESADRAATTALIVDTRTDGNGDGKTYIKTGWVNSGNYGVSTLAVGYYSASRQVRDVITMLGTGSVGVGVSSPGAKLHVSEASGVGNFAALKLTNTVTSVNANVDIIMEAGGQVGARIRAIAPGASHNDLAMYVTNSGTLQATPAIFIQGSTNRVGINRSDPSNTLDVNGSVRTTDWYYVENSGNGMYNNANAMWWASHGSGSYSLSSNTTFSGIKLFSGGSQNTFRGHFYGDADGQGFLNSAGNWSLRLDSSSRLIAYSGIANMNAGIRISMPGGAAYSTQLSTVTGAFKIKLPTGRYKSDSMLRMTIKIYQYSTGQSLTFNVGGYNYNHATNTWLNVFAEQESDSNATVYTVRFGDDGTSNCIWIGETNSTWAYPQVFVSEFEAGYSGTTIDWASGWSISAVTAFDTVYASRTSAVKVTSNNIGTYGVSSITGTANQVTASASTGAVTLSLPQNIHTAATPTFSSLTLSGTGTSTFGGPLTISLAQNADTVLRVTNSDSQALARASIQMTGQGNTWGTYVNNTYVRNYTASAADIEWWTSGIKYATLSSTGNLTVSGTGTSSFAGSVNVDGGINFLRGSGDYSNYIKANDYVDGGYTGSTSKYWIELGAKGGTHIVLNTDGSATSAENAYDHFTIWQAVNGTGAIAAGARKFWITNTGRVNFIDSVWHKSSDGIERIHFGSSGTTFYKGGGTGTIHTFRNASDVDILTLSNAKDAILSGNLAVNGTGTSTINNLSIAPTSGHVYLTGPNTAGKFITLQNGNATGGINFRDSAGNEVGSYYQVTDAWTFSKNTTISGNLTVSGNLIINGTTTTVNSTTTTLDDPIITLGGDTAPTVDDNKDRGVEFRWHNGTAAKVGFFGYDDSSGYFTFIPDATNTSEVFSGTKGTIDANLVGNVTGNVSGSAGSVATLTAGTYLTGGSFNGSTNVTFAVDATSANTASKVVARDGSGNFSAGSITAASLIAGNAGTSLGSSPVVINGTVGDNDSHLIIKKPSQSSFSFLAWDGGNYISSNTYYENGAWVHNAPTGNTNSQLLNFIPGTGVKWWSSSNSTSTWNVSSDLLLWNDSGVWQRSLSNTLTLATSGTGLSGSATYNNSGAVTFTVTSNATNANTASTIVARDASGNFTAGTISASLIGSSVTLGSRVNNTAFGGNTNGLTLNSVAEIRSPQASNAPALTWHYENNASRHLLLKSTGEFNFVAPTNENSGVAVVQINGNLVWHAGNDGSGSGLDADLLDGLNAASANTASTIVARDASGNFSAGTITSTSISTTSGGSNGVRVHTNSGITASNNYMNFFTSQTSGWAFNANGTGADTNTLVVIDAAGDLGIGTTNPVYRLQLGTHFSGTQAETSMFINAGGQAVAGAIFISPDGNSSVGAKIGQYFESPANIQRLDLGTVGYSGVYPTISIEEGKVGIGTTAPQRKLDILGGDIMVRSTSDTGTSVVNFGSTTYYPRASIRSTGLASPVGDANLSFWTRNSGTEYERITILNNGNVGIGVVSPSAVFDISGNSVQDVGLVRFVNGSTSGTFVPTASFVQTRGNHSFGIVAEFRTNTAGDTDRPTILFRGAQAAHQWRVGQVTNGWGTNDNFGIGYVASNASPAAWPTNYFTITTGGNVGIGVGTSAPGYKLEVNGSFAATTKSFVIPHPTKEGKKLRYGSLEGPENGVYVRGKLKGSNIIELPDYWTKLVDPESITVQLTPIGSHQKLYVEKIEDNKVYIANENLLAKAINCFFYVLAERCDVEKLEVEIDA